MIDLRSDTVTRPTPGMLEFMCKAEVGDDVFKEDPTVNAFEQKVAKLFGQQAGLFVPSGTMSNQICLNVLTQPGEEIILDEYAHIFNYESGAGAVLSGVQLRPLKGTRGLLNAEIVEAAIRPRNDWDPHTRVIALENTTNKGGGSWYDLETIQSIREVADRHQLALHLDGARIWNALTEADYTADEIGGPFETISVCFSKGLGAPVGSMMLSSEANIKKARRMRKMFGGGMRQIGMLAAAADYALEHHYPLMKKDHERAVELAKVIHASTNFEIDLDSVKTNILLFDVKNGTADPALAEMKAQGIAMSAFGPKTIRAVLHFQILENEFERVLEYFRAK